jgi:hypothetical protein
MRRALTSARRILTWLNHAVKGMPVEPYEGRLVMLSGWAVEAEQARVARHARGACHARPKRASRAELNRRGQMAIQRVVAREV